MGKIDGTKNYDAVVYSSPTREGEEFFIICDEGQPEVYKKALKKAAESGSGVSIPISDVVASFEIWVKAGGQPTHPDKGQLSEAFGQDQKKINEDAIIKKILEEGSVKNQIKFHGGNFQI